MIDSYNLLPLSYGLGQMDLNERKPVFVVYDHVIPKLACSATETTENSAIMLVANLDMILSFKQITEALIRLYKCRGWCAPLFISNPEDRFSCIKAQIISVIFRV